MTKLKVGDVLVEVLRDRTRRTFPVLKVGRLWATTLHGRVNMQPDAFGRCAVDTGGYGSDRKVYVSHHAADVALWKRKALTELRRCVDRLNAETLRVETLEAALTLLSVEHEPAPTLRGAKVDDVIEP